MNASGLWFDVRKAEAERAKGRQYWTYNGGRPAIGALLIDTPATDARVIPWACFKHGVEVYFQWHGVHWRHNSQKQGERNQNVWANPVTFDNRGQPNKPTNDQNFANGDGVLLYPGEEMLHPEENRGVAGPISTVQLANLRRGLQDHLYLTMARKLGLNAEIEPRCERLCRAFFPTQAIKSALRKPATLLKRRATNWPKPSRQKAENDRAVLFDRKRGGDENLLTVVLSHAACAALGLTVIATQSLPKITRPVMFDTPEADRILAALQVFPPDNPWNQDISTAPLRANSAAIIASIGKDKHIDFNLDMNYIIVPPNQPRAGEDQRLS